ncbi:MAG: thioredoxin family protein [Porticoccaceae bacterium]|nr:thioredoxin family protein [Porticoccaceae bacterium]
MLKAISKTLCSIAVMAVAGGALAEKGEPWITDMDQAQKIAKTENKDIFVYFTGSDWCGWCIKLDEEVLSKPAFIDYAKDNLVLVELDFPSDEDLISEEQLEHNEEWQDRFEPQGFPTVYLTDHTAAAYAITGYEEGGADSYIKNLKAFRDGQEATAKLAAKAAKASGLERARLLDQLLEHPGVIIEDRNDKVVEIAKLSKGQDDALFKKYNAMVLSQQINEAVMAIGRDISNEERLEKVLGVFNDYKHLKQGSSLESLLAQLGDSFIGADQGKEGVAFMQSVIADSSYSMGMRQSAALFKGIINANTSGGAKKDSLSYFDHAITMDPESIPGKRAKSFKERMLKATASDAQ